MKYVVQVFVYKIIDSGKETEEWDMVICLDAGTFKSQEKAMKKALEIQSKERR